MIFRKRGTPAVICLPSGPVGLWQKRRSAKAKARMAGVAVGGSMALAGCTTFGTNVSGDFACRAPDGICAPSTVIDERALAMISGGSPYQPAGPYPVAPTRPGPQMASLAARTTLRPVQVARTDQKVLTVVFPAHVDGQGRLFEATTVRTVVDSGSWSVADAASPVQAVGVPNAVEVGLSASGPTGGAVNVASVDPMIAPDMVPPVLAIDPDLPSAEAVAEARARGRPPESQAPVVTAAASPATSQINAPRGFAASVED